MSAAGSTRLLLVRHGESNTTVDRVVGGMRADSGLSDLGRLQAAALRDRFAAGDGPTVDALWSSTMPRAIETAEALQPALDDLLLVTDDELQEHRPGEGDGLTFEDFRATFGMPNWLRNPHLPLSPTGESLAEFHRRVGAALHRVIDEHSGRTIMVVCHGGVIEATFRSFLGLPPVGGFGMWTTNCSISEFTRSEGDGPFANWNIVRYNDSAHLAGLPRQTNPEVSG